MNSFELFSALNSFLISIRILKNYLAIELSFPLNWKVNSSENELINIVETTEDKGDKKFLFVVEFNEENMKLLIETILKTIRINKEIEEKEKLFNKKLNEMKVIFEREDLSTLLDFKFTIESENDYSLEPENEFKEGENDK